MTKKDLERIDMKTTYINNQLNFMMVWIFLLSVVLVVLLGVGLFYGSKIPREQCHTEKETFMITLEPNCFSGRFSGACMGDSYALPKGAKYSCEDGVFYWSFPRELEIYSGEPKTCMITTKTKVCEIK